VQVAGNVGRGHGNGEGLLLGIGITVEAVAIHPHLIDLGLHLLRVIHLRKFFVHKLSLLFSEHECSYLHKFDLLRKSREFLIAQKKKRPEPNGSGRTNCPWYHLNSGKSRTLGRVFTPFPDNGGITVETY
jgi:hypothetical protein